MKRSFIWTLVFRKKNFVGFGHTKVRLALDSSYTFNIRAFCFGRLKYFHLHSHLFVPYRSHINIRSSIIL